MFVFCVTIKTLCICFGSSVYVYVLVQATLFLVSSKSVPSMLYDSWSAPGFCFFQALLDTWYMSGTCSTVQCLLLSVSCHCLYLCLLVLYLCLLVLCLLLPLWLLVLCLCLSLHLPILCLCTSPALVYTLQLRCCDNVPVQLWCLLTNPFSIVCAFLLSCSK